MASADIDVHGPTILDDRHAEAPITLDQPAPKSLGFFDQVGLWGNLGVSLLLPVAASAWPCEDRRTLSVGACVLAVVAALSVPLVVLAGVLRFGSPWLPLSVSLIFTALSFSGRRNIPGFA